MTTFVLVVHVLSVIIGLGAAFSFPVLGVLAERNPEFAPALYRGIQAISQRLVLPVGLVTLLTGIVLIFQLNLNLTKNAWLGSALIIYLVILGYAAFIQRPAGTRLVTLSARGLSAETAALGNRLKIGGMILLTGVVVIAVLMVWKPGAG